MWLAHTAARSHSGVQRLNGSPCFSAMIHLASVVWQPPGRNGAPHHLRQPIPTAQHCQRQDGSGAAAPEEHRRRTVHEPIQEGAAQQFLGVAAALRA